MLYLWIVLMIVGFVLLVKGADWFVDGSAGIARKCHVSALVIGLTVVAFGTSAPELAVSVTSALRHSTEISIGNVIGSNITNVLLILGVSALIHNLPVRKNSLVLDLPVCLLGSALIIGLGAWQNSLVWWDGVILLSVFALYLALLFGVNLHDRRAAARGEIALPPAHEQEPPKGKLQTWFAKMEEKLWFLIVLTLVGLGMVVGGGTLLVDGARYIAEYFGVGEDVIGLTIVALGTSLPELVTSAVAAYKGETDIAVGNIIGSNIFNIFFVAGVACLISPIPFSVQTNLVDAIVAFVAVLLLYGFSLGKNQRVGRLAGAIFLALFAAYYGYLFVVRL